MFDVNLLKRETMHPHSNRGFSLIEVLMVMAIFSIGILAVMTLQISAINSNTMARRITTGSAWLGDHLEKIMSMDYSAPELAKGTTQSREESQFTIRHTVSATALPNVKQVDITVIIDPSTGKKVGVKYYKAKKY